MADPPTLVVRVQHHPSRRELLDRLLPGLEGLPVEVVNDPEPNAKPSAWRTYRLCLRAQENASWLVVVQDDAIPADGFAAALPRILAANEGTIVCLFVAGAPVRFARELRQADARGARYVDHRWLDWTPTVATAWPAEQAARMIEWADHRGVAPDHIGDDNLVGRFVRETRAAVRATVPSIVQHPDIEPSLIGRRHRGGRNPLRVAAVWTGHASYEW